MSDNAAVNEHYLNRLVEAGETRGVEATEDIVSGNGVKLGPVHTTGLGREGPPPGANQGAAHSPH